MDSEIVKLSSSSRASQRAVGDPPSLGRVGRISRTSLQKGRGGRGGRQGRRGSRGSRGSRRQHRRNLLRGITMLTFLLALLAVLVICSMWLGKRQKMNAVVLAEKPANSRIIERVESKFKSPSEDEALAIVNKAITASDEATLKECFRLGSTDAAAALRYLSELNAKRGAPSGTSWLGSIDVNDMLVEGVLLHWKNDEGADSLQAFLTPNERGVWQVDFESLAGKCMPEWDRFVAGEANEGIVRVWFSSDNYYNGPFVDESKWVCFSMARSDSDEILSGYCRAGSPQAAAMASIRKRVHMRGRKNFSSFRVTLEISRPKGAERRQCEIKRVLAEDWVLSAKPYDGVASH